MTDEQNYDGLLSGEEQLVDPEGPEKTGKKKVGKKDSAETSRPSRVRIMIPSQPGEDGRSDVFVSTGDRDYLIKRDMEVEVPLSVINALDCAVFTEQITDESGRFAGSRDVMRFPYQKR